jgi:hypothetical protein
VPAPFPARPPARWTAGLLAALTFLIAAGATIWGSFEKIQTYRDEFPNPSGGNSVIGYTLYWWKLDEVDPRPLRSTPSFPPYGLLLAVSAGLLVLGAVLAFAAFANRRPGLVTATRVGSALGVGLLAGAVSVRLMDGLQALSEANAREPEAGETITFRIGLGIWLPGGAAALGLIGLILILTRARTAGARVEPDTPRLGIPMPYGGQPYQQPYQAAPQPGAPQPATPQPYQPAVLQRGQTHPQPQAQPGPPPAAEAAKQPETPPEPGQTGEKR